MSFGVGVDQSDQALWMARKNAAALGLAARCHFGQGGWRAAGEPLHLPRQNAAFDVILSNPPYIASAEIDCLEPEVKDFDPRAALDGGTDGLDPYRAILGGFRPFLVPGGLVAVEIGWTQGEAVARLFAEAGLSDVTVTQDLGGRDRVVTGRG
jgi:release factor glutamine methyltransferase